MLGKHLKNTAVRWLVALAAPLALLLPASAASAGTPHYTLRLATWGAPTAPQVATFVPLFTKLVEQGSHGQISVQSFPAGSLVKEQVVPSAVQNDVADISLTLMGTWISTAPLVGIVDTPFFAPSSEKYEDVIGPGSTLFKALNEAMAKRGVMLLVALDNGSPIIVSNVPLTSPSTFHGKTVRVYDKPTGEIIKTLGGAPSTITVSDVYPALQRGTVTAALGGLEGAIGLKEYEVTKYLLDPNGLFGLLINGYVMNRHAYDSLPKDLQAVVTNAADKAGRVTNAAMIQAFQVQLSEMEKHGMKVTVLKPGTASYKAFQDALAPLAKRDEKRFPQDIVQAVLKAEQ